MFDQTVWMVWLFVVSMCPEYCCLGAVLKIFVVKKKSYTVCASKQLSVCELIALPEHYRSDCAGSLQYCRRL